LWLNSWLQEHDAKPSHKVDDDPDVRWITAEDLRTIGHFVAEADSGRAALTHIERGNACDLVVIDLVMPGLSGSDTVRLARRTRPDLKVLFTSGYAELSGFEEDIGNDALLKKPFNRDALAEAVKRALDRVSLNESDNVVPLRRGEKP
jgi:two-component system cell cycle sensor histidine kinase/response regulator CckA